MLPENSFLGFLLISYVFQVVNRCQRVRRDEVLGPQARDETASSFSSMYSWSSSSVATVISSSSSSVQVHHQEQFELREVNQLQPVIKNAYQESGDDGPESKVVPNEVSVPREGKLRPFNPPLISSPIPLDPVSDADEDSSSEDPFSTPMNRISIISNSYRSELAQSFQSQLAQDLSVSGDYNISDLWPEIVDQDTVERVSKKKIVDTKKIFFIKFPFYTRGLLVFFFENINTNI